MGNIQIILKKDVPNLGEEGDVKSVKTGYARNFLYPRGLAVDYSLKNRNILEKQKSVIENKKLQKKENAGSLKLKLETEKIKLSIPAGDKGRLYGTVTNTQIAEELLAKGYQIERKMIELKEHVKFAGTYKFSVHLYQDIYANLELIVEAKEEEKKEDTRQVRKRKRYDRYDENRQEESTAETDNEAVESSVEDDNNEEA